MNHYRKLGLMVGTSTIGILGLMYLNRYQLAHVFFSETRAFMALIMGAAMAFIVVLFMGRMHPNRKANVAILSASGVTFVVSPGHPRFCVSEDEQR